MRKGRIVEPVTIERAVQTVAADVEALTHDGRVLIGITGPPGAGKSTLATALADHLGAAYVPMDGFHLSNAQLDRLGRRARKGAVDTFDAAGYVALLQRVLDAAGHGDVYAPGFDRRLDEPVAATHVVPARAEVVVTEGNYLALAEPPWLQVRALAHLLYYADNSETVRRERLLRRHTDGGRSLGDAQAWVDDVDEPNARLIAGTRTRCDRVFDFQMP